MWNTYYLFRIYDACAYNLDRLPNIRSESKKNVAQQRYESLIILICGEFW